MVAVMSRPSKFAHVHDIDIDIMSACVTVYNYDIVYNIMLWYVHVLWHCVYVYAVSITTTEARSRSVPMTGQL